MEIAEDFHELSRQYAKWFVQTLPASINLSDVNPEEMFKTRKSLKISMEKLFKLMIKERYLLVPDDESEKWLLKHASFDFGVIGFLLDILYNEADETSEKLLPFHMHDMPNKLPKVFLVLISQLSHEIFQSLVKLNCPDPLIFGELEKNKTFQKKLDEDYSKAIEFFSKKYCSSFK